MPNGNWIKSHYEAIEATCEHCQRESIFNRASDLKSFAAVSGQMVVCTFADCAKEFHVMGDLINPDYQMIVFDSQALYQLKRYGLVVLSLAQAWEVFFANFLRIKLAYKPFMLHDDLEQINVDLQKLFESTKDLTFSKLRNIFLRLIMHPANATTVDEFIAELPRLVGEPSPDDLILIPDEIRPYAEALYKSGLGKVRNEVVHKNAYRPKKGEVDAFVHETENNLYPLGQKLDVNGDDVHWHTRERSAS